MPVSVVAAHMQKRPQPASLSSLNVSCDSGIPLSAMNVTRTNPAGSARKTT